VPKVIWRVGNHFEEALLQVFFNNLQAIASQSA
jgi:hypothetical protein